jgi:hypothetical protein
MTRHAILVGAALVGLAGCGSPAPPPAPPRPAVPQPAAVPAAPVAPAPGPAAPAAATVAKPGAPSLVPPAPDVPKPTQALYAAKGRRDPFVVIEPKVEKTSGGGLAVAMTRLTGIVRGAQSLALIETPEGIGYILRTGDTLGDGRLVEIGADTVVFTVAPKPGSTSNRVVLKLAAN